MEVMAKDKKEETEQESAESTEPAKKSCRTVATAKGKTKDIVEQAEEIEQESVETSEPEKKSKKRGVKKAVPVTKSRKQTHKNMEMNTVKIAADEPSSSGTTQTKENEESSERHVTPCKRKATSPAGGDESEQVSETESAETTTTAKKDNKTGVPVTKSKKQKINLVSGKLFGMGQNICGQLGFGEEVQEKEIPVLLEVPDNITSIAAGGMHSVCLTESGEVITFGCNDEGALGRITVDGDEEVSPGRVEINERIIQISAGDSHSAALTESGQVYLWGNFRKGDGPMGLTSDGVKQMRPIRILNNIQIIKISSGDDHLACLSSNGIVYTCGCGQNGQLGRLTEQTADMLEPAAVLVIGLSSLRTRTVLIEDIWTSNYSTFLKARETGLIYAFGLNNYSQLGYENKRVAYAPTFFTNFNTSFNNSQTWKEIAGGQHHTLSLDNDGRVYSVGCRNYGRLGLGANCSNKSAPTLISSLQNETCTTIACGDDVSFAVTEEGSLYSWGNGEKYQLGHGDDEDCNVPRLVEGDFAKSWKALKVSSGGQHTLVLATPKETFKK